MCRKNKILFGFFFGFYSIILTGQLYQSDSLERILRSDTISDSHKFDILQDLCWEYIASDHPKVTQYIGEMVVLNLKLNGSKKTYNVENLLGLYYKSRGTFDKAFYHFHEALKVTESEKNTTYMLWTLFRLGDLSNFAYNKVKGSKSDTKYFLKALDYFKGNYKNPRLLVLLQNGLAVAYANDNKNDQALEMLNKSAVVFEKNDFQGKEFNLGFFYNQLGRVYMQLSDYTKAEKYINKALTVAENLSIVDLKISAYYYMGEILFHQKKWDAAESYYIKRLALEKNKSYLIKSDAIQDLLLFYQKTQNKDKILQLIPQYISIQDSATQQIIENKYAEFEVAFKVKEKELQNDILTKEKDYQKNKATILQILGSALLLLLGLVVGLWYRLKKHSTELKKANEYKDKILNVMGHDIRSPLISQLTVIQDLLENKDKISRDSLNDIYQLSLSVFKISDNVYNWVKRTRGLQNFRYEVCQIYYELLLVTEQYDPVFKNKKLKLHLSIDAIKASKVIGDRLGIQAVIRNLVDNASKYAPEGSDVFIEMQQDDKSVYFQISNESVVQQKEGIKRKGLGLQLVKEILEYNQGEVVFVSNNQGRYITKISFTLAS